MPLTEYQLQRAYGISLEEFDRLVKKQNGRCAICSEAFSKTPHVDHDHQTGQIRGLLCLPCNTGLGFFQDSVVLLAHAIVYLEENGADLEIEMEQQWDTD